ncbi:MAG: zinc ribbon domain-containing protein [Minicystis sp.]
MSREEEITDKPGDDDRALDQRLTEYLKLGIPVATLACAVAAGYAQGAPAVVLVLAGGALVGVIAIFWASIRTLVGETPLSGADAYALGAPRAEEEQKRAVLRALKDLEFERSVGKISEEDYEALVAKYRAEAKRLLRVLDEESQPEREKVEEILLERLQQAGLAEGEAPPAKKKKGAKPATKKAAEKREEPKAEAEKAEPEKAEPEETEKPRTTAKARCTDCGTMNDADAVFCKKCGARQGPIVDDDDEEEEDVKEEPRRKEASS